MFKLSLYEVYDLGDMLSKHIPSLLQLFVDMVIKQVNVSVVDMVVKYRTELQQDVFRHRCVTLVDEQQWLCHLFHPRGFEYLKYLHPHHPEPAPSLATWNWLSVTPLQVLPPTMIGLPPELQRDVQGSNDGFCRWASEDVPVRTTSPRLRGCGCGRILDICFVVCAFYVLNAQQSTSVGIPSQDVHKSRSLSLDLSTHAQQEDHLFKLGEKLTEAFSGEPGGSTRGEGLPSDVVAEVASLSRTDWSVCLERYVDFRR